MATKLYKRRGDYQERSVDTLTAEGSKKALETANKLEARVECKQGKMRHPREPL